MAIEQTNNDQNKKRLKIDSDKCTSCGTCIATRDDIFEFGEDGKAKVKDEADFSNEDLDSLKGLCPSAAIAEEQ
ncbi:ferredoxin [Candidatus Dojkabacteria bacterium]|nr:ferredoxin [Candidatus Dojkabacteria bacterium]